MNDKQLKKHYNMSDSEKRSHTKKLLKQARAYAISSVAGVGLILLCGAMCAVNIAAKRKDVIEFEKANNLNYTSYLEETHSKEILGLQKKVMLGDLSFEEYETAKGDLETLSETEYLQTLEPEIIKEHKELENKVDRAIGYGFVGTLLSATPAITFAALSEKKSKEYKEYRELGY